MSCSFLDRSSMTEPDASTRGSMTRPVLLESCSHAWKDLRSDRTARSPVRWRRWASAGRCSSCATPSTACGASTTSRPTWTSPRRSCQTGSTGWSRTGSSPACRTRRTPGATSTSSPRAAVELWPVIHALLVWGGKHRRPNSRVFRHAQCGTRLTESGHCERLRGDARAGGPHHRAPARLPADARRPGDAGAARAAPAAGADRDLTARRGGAGGAGMKARIGAVPARRASGDSHHVGIGYPLLTFARHPWACAAT